MKLKNKLLLGGLTAVLLAVMSFSAWKIWVIRSEYHTGEAAYEDISHMISLPQKTAEPQPPVINKPAGAETLPDEDDTVWPEVDFAALREINPDIVAWIYIEGTKINYPIVQGEENSYYLKHLFSGEVEWIRLYIPGFPKRRKFCRPALHNLWTSYEERHNVYRP